MNQYLAFILNFLPLLLCGAVFYYYAKMSLKEELVSCLFGLLAVIPIIVIKLLLCELFPDSYDPFAADKISFSSLLSENLIFAGLVEELMKALFIALIPHKKIEFRNFFMASILCGLAVGCFESVTYVLNFILASKGTGAEPVWSLIFVRMISSDFLHALCAGLSGIFVYSIKTKKIDFVPIIYAIFIHGIYDFFECFKIKIHWFSVAALLFAVFECRVHYEKVLDAELAEILEEDRKKAQASAKGKTRKTSVTKGRKTRETNADVTVVTSTSKIVRKKTSAEDKPVVKTKTRARKIKPVETEELPEPDVTPEFNEE